MDLADDIGETDKNRNVEIEELVVDRITIGGGVERRL